MGDFAGSSAYELIDTLKKYSGIARRVFIHTVERTIKETGGK